MLSDKYLKAGVKMEKTILKKNFAETSPKVTAAQSEHCLMKPMLSEMKFMIENLG